MRPARHLRFWLATMACGLLFGCALSWLVDNKWPLGRKATAERHAIGDLPPRVSSESRRAANLEPAPTTIVDPMVAACQHLSPAAPYPIHAIDCANGCCGPNCWAGAQPVDWQPYAQGEYVGHARLAHVPEYRLRVDDLLECVFRVTRDEQSQPYRLNVGDEIRVESLSDPTL